MSHQVQINYEAIAIQCNSICEVAEKQLKELDRLLAEIESESTQLLNEQTRALKRQILSERESLLEEMKQSILQEICKIRSIFWHLNR